MQPGFQQCGDFLVVQVRHREMAVAADADGGKVGHVRVPAIGIDEVDEFLRHDVAALPDLDIGPGRCRLAGDRKVVPPDDLDRYFCEHIMKSESGTAVPAAGPSGPSIRAARSSCAPVHSAAEYSPASEKSASGAATAATPATVSGSVATVATVAGDDLRFSTASDTSGKNVLNRAIAVAPHDLPGLPTLLAPDFRPALDPHQPEVTFENAGQAASGRRVADRARTKLADMPQSNPIRVP
jgi:hypothetical protein